MGIACVTWGSLALVQADTYKKKKAALYMMDGGLCSCLCFMGSEY